jgi:hypothetical protein
MGGKGAMPTLREKVDLFVNETARSIHRMYGAKEDDERLGIVEDELRRAMLLTVLKLRGMKKRRARCGSGMFYW